jgi:hypothetical protein
MRRRTVITRAAAAGLSLFSQDVTILPVEMTLLRTQ